MTLRQILSRQSIQPTKSIEQPRLFLGDCLDIMKILESESVHAVITDPPYSLEIMGKAWDKFKNYDAGFGYYLSGLIDGEGCFRITSAERGTGACCFFIKLRRDDKAILEKAQRYLDIGCVLDVEPDVGSNSKPLSKWIVQTKEDCQTLRDFLYMFPLRAKKLHDFVLWAEAVTEKENMVPGNRWHGKGDYSRIIALKEQLSKVRQYREPFWSGNGFQDFTRRWAEEALRILKPGGYLLSFGGTRTYHRMATGVEDAGFEITDMINWVFASGYPKVHHLDKLIKDDDLREKYGTWTTGHLKPAHEPLVLAKKPFNGSVAKNLAEWNVGGFNVEACRAGDKFPANVIHDGSDEVLQATGETASMFVCAKASTKERDEGLDGLPKKIVPWFQTSGGTSGKASSIAATRKTERVNHHPSVKPVDLMGYLCRLVTPPNGIVLDPFMGSGTTGKAAMKEGFQFIGIEHEKEYFDHAMKRIEYEYNRLYPGRESNFLQFEKEETRKE